MDRECAWISCERGQMARNGMGDSQPFSFLSQARWGRVIALLSPPSLPPACHPHRRRALRCTEQESDAGSIYASATFERGIFLVEQDANERAILYRGCFEEDRVGRSGYVRVVLFFFGTRKLERRTRGHMIHFLKNVMENRTGHASREAYHRRDVEIEQAWPHSASELGWLRWAG